MLLLTHVIHTHTHTQNSVPLVCEELYAKIIQMLSVARTGSNEKPPAKSWALFADHISKEKLKIQ